MSQQQVTEDAERATKLILSGLDVEPDSLLETKVREAYLLGRTDQAAENFNNLVTRFRNEAQLS